jgi:hypothetical protein
MPQCMAMGQAVGTTAAMAHQAGCTVQAVHFPAVVAALATQGINRIGGAH